MKILNRIFLILVLAGIFSPEAFAAEKIKVAATNGILADLTAEIVKDRAEVYRIASPKRDIHFYAPTPRDVMKVKKADVFVHQGLDLEAWRGPLLNAAGNPRFLNYGPALIDVSKGVPFLEIPSSLSRSEGDIHAFGNPHYLIDPENAKIAARNIAASMAAGYPEEADFFKKNEEAFLQKLNEKIKDWAGRMAPFQGQPVVTYHRSWVYFARRFGLVCIGEVEPKPGIPPTAKHIASLTAAMKEKGVKVILKETYRESGGPKKIAEAAGARVLTLAQDVGEVSEAADYISLIEYDVRLIENALGAKGERS